ncbi:MAG: dephospho-CoA kinase [Oscillospiraceae bacterium]|nr:dephospho-CoA kinase [Oscillospiraceae bacterium]
MITCPNCGEITRDELLIFNDDLRRQNFSLTPVLPTCKLCGAEAVVTHKCGGGNIIVLTGTCGSGKSTIAEILAEQGFLAIDGDCVVQVIKRNNNDLLDEIAYEIDVLSLLGGNFVLSHVIGPEDLERCVEIFQARNLNYSFFLLKPTYQTAVERCRTRTCHESVTPEKWIRKFYDELVFDDRVMTVDNTNMSAEETAEYILKKV